MMLMPLYLNLKDDLIKKMIDGTYAVGQALPTEHELCEQYQLSRVTVRKSLDELKKSGLLTGIPRVGTVVTQRTGGYNSSLDLIALVAAVQDPFFAIFMEHFEAIAEENGSLMLFKQDFQGEAYRSGDMFFRFIQRNIRNVVIWPQTDRIDFALFNRLRSVGINFVIFDQPFDNAIADVVCLDNADAVLALYRNLRQSHAGEIIYIGYENLSLPSSLTREATFRGLAGAGRVYNIPWRKSIERETAALLDRLEHAGVLPAGIICNSGGIGLAVAKHLRDRGQTGVPLATIDYMPEMNGYPILAYEQPIKQLAEKSYQRLVAQINQGGAWQAGIYRLKGKVIDCSQE